MTLHFGIISIFPEMFNALKTGVVGKAFENNLASLKCFNPRDWAKSNDGRVDDRPYGGGPGMVMMYEPLHLAIIHAKKELPLNTKTVYLSPQGKNIRQDKLCQLSQNQQPLLFVAGRYEGIDERLFRDDIDEEWSLGDFVLSGGELAAMTFMDAMIRLIPGALNDERSSIEDSFMNGLLDCPHYTRPAEIAGLKVPDVLLSGSHHAIAKWRRKQALGQTWLKRQDLLQSMELSDKDQQLLTEFQQDNEAKTSCKE